MARRVARLLESCVGSGAFGAGTGLADGKMIGTSKLVVYMSMPLMEMTCATGRGPPISRLRANTFSSQARK